LLDPRVTQNLPTWKIKRSLRHLYAQFSIIGKGKRARQYSHLYKAVKKQHNHGQKSSKICHILDIWKEGLGVISLHCFQSVIPVEAYKREACMLCAIGMHKVTNEKKGDFYGPPKSWTMNSQTKLGFCLLHKAMKILLAEGKRQICLPNIKGS